MIPEFDASGMLPEGVHPASWHELTERFGGSVRRQDLLRRMEGGLRLLVRCGVESAWIDGSFISSKEAPGDVDGCWEWNPKVELTELGPFLLRTRADRELLMREYGMDFFLAQTTEASSGLPFTEFFQRKREGGKKGIVLLSLATLADGLSQ